MKQYLDLLNHVIKHGEDQSNRTGVDARSIFGYQMRFNLREGFPLLTTKKMHWKSIVHELLWFMRGDTNIKYLNDNGITIWDEWADGNGNIGPGYGCQWRAWPHYHKICDYGKDYEHMGTSYRLNHIDQLQKSLDTLRTNPQCRRNIISAWNVGQLDEMKLPPCHVLCQFYVDSKGLSCQMYQRSCDLFLGVPFNIASYALLTHIMGNMSGIPVKEFIWTGGNVHLYKNHFEQAVTQLNRKPKELPILLIDEIRDEFEDWKFEDFEIAIYFPHPTIKAPVAV